MTIKTSLSTSSDKFMRQIREMIEANTKLKVFDAPGYNEFFANREAKDQTPGVTSIFGKIDSTGNLVIYFGLIKLDDITIENQLQNLLELEVNTGILKKNENVVEVKAVLKLEPLTPIRAEQIQKQFKNINELSIFLKKALQPNTKDAKDLLDKYKNVRDFIDPIIPFEESAQIPENLLPLIREVIEMFKTGICMALSCESRITTDYFLKAVSSELISNGQSIGIFNNMNIAIRGISDVLSKAPGFLVIPSITLSFSTSNYERADEMDSLFAMLEHEEKSILLTGTFKQNQSIMGLGQAKQIDVLKPVVLNLESNAVSKTELIDFATAKYCNGLTDEIQNQIRKNTIAQIESVKGREIKNDLIPAIVKSQIQQQSTSDNYLNNLLNKNESFRGLPVHVQQKRNKGLQEKLLEGMRSGKLKDFLNTNLIGQEEAIESLVEKLWSELLSRPMYQPVQMLIQGTSGIGKSEASRLIAKYLNINHISIDTASFQSHHEASSMLLGSGRGIVQSYLPGKLELAANHHNGCLIEIADLDHCIRNMAGYFSDLWMHILQNGYAQSANGELIFCGNLILVFTINLPGGKDLMLYRGMGFNNTPDKQTIKKGVTKEIKNLFSPAFVGRLGEPVLFQPIPSEKLSELFELALTKTTAISLENLGIAKKEIYLSKGIGSHYISTLNDLEISSGARAVYELARKLLTNMIQNNMEKLQDPGIKSITLFPSNNDEISVKLK